MYEARVSSFLAQLSQLFLAFHWLDSAMWHSSALHFSGSPLRPSSISCLPSGFCRCCFLDCNTCVSPGVVSKPQSNHTFANRWNIWSNHHTWLPGLAICRHSAEVFRRQRRLCLQRSASKNEFRLLGSWLQVFTVHRSTAWMASVSLELSMRTATARPRPEVKDKVCRMAMALMSKVY